MAEGVVFNQHVCAMLEQLRLECFHMAVEQFTVKPEPERCIVEALQFSINQHARPSSHLHCSLRRLCQDGRQDSLVEAKDSAERENKMLHVLI